jgi:hypothetical protein
MLHCNRNINFNYEVAMPALICFVSWKKREIIYVSKPLYNCSKLVSELSSGSWMVIKIDFTVLTFLLFSRAQCPVRCRNSHYVFRNQRSGVVKPPPPSLVGCLFMLHRFASQEMHRQFAHHRDLSRHRKSRFWYLWSNICIGMYS